MPTALRGHAKHSEFVESQNRESQSPTVPPMPTQSRGHGTLGIAPPKSEAAIFARLWTGKEDELTPENARKILEWRFSADEEARMHELAYRNQQGQLSDLELQELDHFVKVGDLLAILQSKARTYLKDSPDPEDDHR